MNFFDIVFAVIIIFFVLLSSSRGSLPEFLSTLGIVAGYFAAERFHLKYINFSLQYMSNVSHAKAVTFFAIFIAFVVAGVILASIANVIFSFKRPTYTSRFLGGLMGLLKGLLVCLLIFFIVEGYVPSYTDDLYNSAFSPWLRGLRNLINGINLALIDNINFV